MLVFKEIIDSLKAINQETTVYRGTGSRDEELAHEKYQLLLEIKEYMRDLEWISREETKDKLIKVVKSNYNYQQVAKLFDTTPKSIKSSISELSKRFKHIIGNSTLKLIEEGNITLARYQFLAGTGKIKTSDFLLPVVRDILSEKVGDFKGIYSLRQCHKEIKFLKKYSIAALEQSLEELNMDKLAFVLFLIEGKDPDDNELKLNLINYITCRLEGAQFKQVVDAYDGKFGL